MDKYQQAGLLLLQTSLGKIAKIRARLESQDAEFLRLQRMFEDNLAKGMGDAETMRTEAGRMAESRTLLASGKIQDLNEYEAKQKDRLAQLQAIINGNAIPKQSLSAKLLGSAH